MNVILIPILFETVETVSKNLEIRERFDTFQTTALLISARTPGRPKDI